MTDDEIAELLRSDRSIVMIEAPAGCGKTFQAAEFAAYAAETIGSQKILVLTHTHAACSVIADRTRQIKDKVDIRTLDGFIHEIASAYSVALGLPNDIAKWVRSEKHGHERLADRVSRFVLANPMVTKALAQRFPVIICDEHQDSNFDQENIVLAITKFGAQLRVFGDPMQVIPGGRGQDARVAEVVRRWAALRRIATFGELAVPHRWRSTNPGLGEWVLEARQQLRDGNPIDLSKQLPPHMELLTAENGALSGQPYRFVPSGGDWQSINAAINRDAGMLCVAGQSNTINGLHLTFRQRLRIWEGHTRNDLDALIVQLVDANKSVGEQANQFVHFLRIRLKINTH